MSKVVICVVLCVISVLLSMFSISISSSFSPAFKIKNFLILIVLLITLASQLAAVYLTASKSPFLAALMIMVFNYYWYMFAPFHPNSDPAGNGMARAFHNLFAFVFAFFGGLFFYLIVKYVVPGGLAVSLVVAAIIGLFNILSNMRSYLSGDSFAQEARWNKMETEDYRKTLFRSSMVESDDSWDAKHLGAEPKELEHWDVYGTKQIAVKTEGDYPCLLIEGHFIFPSRRVDMTFPLYLYRVFKDNGDANDKTSFIPNYVFMVWYDCIERKTYQVCSELPDSLKHNFDDVDAFWLDDVEFRILPKGKLLMFHNRTNQIHDIMIDFPLQGKETSGYDEVVKLYYGVKSLDEIVDSKACAKKETLNGDMMDNYLKRFNYSISVDSETKGVEIQKTICNFFNGEKFLSSIQWNQTKSLARLKDVFVRFKDDRKDYSCFIYFEENEILETFEDAFSADSSQRGVFVVKVGAKRDNFEFSLKVNDKSYSLKNTEFRLYENDMSDEGSLLFKNYSGNHKNKLSFQSILKSFSGVVKEKKTQEKERNSIFAHANCCFSASRSNPVLIEDCNVYAQSSVLDYNCVYVNCGVGEGKANYHDAELSNLPLLLTARWEAVAEQKQYFVSAILPSQQILDIVQSTPDYKDIYWKIDFCFLPGGVVKAYLKSSDRSKSILLDWQANGTEVNDLDGYVRAVKTEMKNNKLMQQRYDAESDYDDEIGDGGVEEDAYVGRGKSQQVAPKTTIPVYENYDYSVCVTFEEKDAIANSIKFYFVDGLIEELKQIEPAKRKMLKVYSLRLKWTSKDEQYTGFFFFDSQQMDKVFNEVYGNAVERKAVLDIYVGKDNDDFRFSLAAEGEKHPIENTEVKVYYHTVNLRRDDVLVYKNYKGEAKNLPKGEPEADEYDCQ